MCFRAEDIRLSDDRLLNKFDLVGREISNMSKSPARHRPTCAKLLQTIGEWLVNRNEFNYINELKVMPREILTQEMQIFFNIATVKKQIILSNYNNGVVA